MDPQLQALVAVHPLGKSVLIGHKLRQLIPGAGLRWCWPVRLDATGDIFYVQHEDYSEFPYPVPLNYLVIGLGELEPTNPLILLQQVGQNVGPFLIRPAPPAPAPLQVPRAAAPTPGAGLRTPLPVFGADLDEQNQALQNAIMNIVQQGSLNDLMDSIIVEYGTLSGRTSSAMPRLGSHTLLRLYLVKSNRTLDSYS
jgi:hypothetical protein